MRAVLAEEVEGTPIVPLCEVADLIRGVSYPKADAREEPVPGFVPVLRATNIQDAKLVLDSDLVFVAERNVSPDQLLREGDIVVATSSGSKHLVGKSGQLHAAWKVSFGAFCATIRPRPGIHPRYLALFLQAPAYWRQISRKALGVNINNLRRGDLESLEIPLPPLAVQASIVAEIEKQFSRLDEAVANLKRVKANLKRYKAAVLKAAVDGRLVPTEAELARREGRSYENAAQLLGRVLEGRRRQAKGRYKEPDTQYTGALPALPEGWVWASAEQCCASVRDGTHDTPAYVTSGIPLVTSKNLLDDGIDFDNTKHISVADHHEISRRSAVARGDVLFAMIGTVGNPTEVKTERPFSIKNVGLFKGDDDCLSAAYLCHWLSSPVLCAWLRPRLKGTTQKFAPLGLLRELPIALPPRSEQDRIVAEVDRQLSTVAAFERSASAEIGSAQLRRAILHEVFRLSRGSGSPRSAECS
ncbi:MAG: restriction endonuclease subunit S [Rhodocyclaceae bacterium]|nr:restriction endonuclease subunit S [Rhodocyclaceae bacterium]